MSLAIRLHTTANTPIKAVRFITCTLVPPPKKAVLAALGIPLTPGGKPEAPTPIVRKAESDVRNFNAVSLCSNWPYVVLGCGQRVRYLHNIFDHTTTHHNLGVHLTPSCLL